VCNAQQERTPARSDLADALGVLLVIFQLVLARLYVHYALMDSIQMQQQPFAPNVQLASMALHRG
jgi:hypothetical protein